MPCSACQKRRKKLLALREAKKAKGQKAQAAAIGVALAVTGAVGKAIHGEADNVQERDSAGRNGDHPTSD